MTDMEDKSRRNNIRLVGLPEGMEGSDVAGFLRINLSKWIPSLRGRDIEIDRAHHVYDGRKNSDRPHTLIFRVLRWHDRLEILKGARQAYPVKCTQDNVTLLFFPDFSSVTAAKRKSLVPVLRSMTALGLQPFLAYPAVIQLRHEGEQRCFNSLWKAEDFVGSLSQSGTFAADPGEKKGQREGGSCPFFDLTGGAWWSVWRRWWRERYGWLLDQFLLFSSFLSPPGIVFFIFIRYNCPLAGKTNPPPPFFFSFFFFWRGLMESRFHYNNVLVMWAFWEARCGLKWIGHGSSQVFVVQSDLCSR